MAAIVERDDVTGYDTLVYTNNGTTASWDSGTASTTQAAEIAYGFCTTFDTAATFSAGTNWDSVTGTGLSFGNVSSADGDSVFLEARTLSSTGGYNATGTSNSSVATESLIATWKT